MCIGGVWSRCLGISILNDEENEVFLKQIPKGKKIFHNLQYESVMVYNVEICEENQ